MEKLRTLIEKYGRWQPLEEYIQRIEAFAEIDFSTSVENSKSLLETISKEICKCKNMPYESSDSLNALLKKSFLALGFRNDSLITQISSSLANIGQQLGNLRNEIGSTSHGRTLDELKERNNKVDDMTKDFLIESTVIITAFLIKNFENENPRYKSSSDKIKLLYESNENFNDFWDDTYGEFEMGDYSYTASEILYNIDYNAYETEIKSFNMELSNEKTN